MGIAAAAEGRLDAERPPPRAGFQQSSARGVPRAGHAVEECRVFARAEIRDGEAKVSIALPVDEEPAGRQEAAITDGADRVRARFQSNEDPKRTSPLEVTRPLKLGQRSTAASTNGDDLARLDRRLREDEEERGPGGSGEQAGGENGSRGCEGDACRPVHGAILASVRRDR